MFIDYQAIGRRMRRAGRQGGVIRRRPRVFSGGLEMLGGTQRDTGKICSWKKEKQKIELQSNIKKYCSRNTSNVTRIFTMLDRTVWHQSSRETKSVMQEVMI